jgi:hypothetical protein
MRRFLQVCFFAGLCVRVPADTGDQARVTADDRKFWAFQPVGKSAPPKVKNKAWPRGASSIVVQLYRSVAG